MKYCIHDNIAVLQRGTVVLDETRAASYMVIDQTKSLCIVNNSISGLDLSYHTS